MSRITTGASNLGKMAKEYSMEVKTLVSLINAYPELKEKIEAHTKDCKNKGSKTLPPRLVNEIFETLGDP
jgi:hypothetical protein